MSYAASSAYAQAAYSPPQGNQPVAVGMATYHFLRTPTNFQWWQFLGIAFIIFVAARHWGKFVNEVA